MEKQPRRSLFFEGSRLYYITEICKIIQKSGGSVYEDILSRKLYEESKKNEKIHINFKLLGSMKKNTSGWGYLNNAETIGLIEGTGVTKGLKSERRRQYNNTGVGQTVSMLNDILNDSNSLLKISLSEKILLLYQFFLLDEMWENEWFINLLSTIPSNYVLENELITKISQNNKYEDFEPRTQLHRIFPRLQWFYDLSLIDMETNDKNRYYKLSIAGRKIFKNLKYVNVKEYSKVIIDSYNIKLKNIYNFYDELINIYNIIKRNLYNTSYINISTLRFFLIVKYIINGHNFDIIDFNDNIKFLWENRKLELASSSVSKNEGIIINDKKYNYINII